MSYLFFLKIRIEKGSIFAENRAFNPKLGEYL